MRCYRSLNSRTSRTIPQRGKGLTSSACALAESIASESHQTRGAGQGRAGHYSEANCYNKLMETYDTDGAQSTAVSCVSLPQEISKTIVEIDESVSERDP